MACPMMSTIDGGHYQRPLSRVRAGTPDAYEEAAFFLLIVKRVSMLCLIIRHGKRLDHLRMERRLSAPARGAGRPDRPDRHEDFSHWRSGTKIPQPLEDEAEVIADGVYLVCEASPLRKFRPLWPSSLQCSHGCSNDYPTPRSIGSMNSCHGIGKSAPQPDAYQ